MAKFAKKIDIQNEADRIFDYLIRTHTVNTQRMRDRACLWHSVSMFLAFAKHAPGCRVLIQAGSASFRYVAEDKDDGVQPTHFAWEYSEWPKEHLVEMTLPEVHVWVAAKLPGCKGHVFIDRITRSLPQLVEDMGHKWLMPQPPRTLWACGDELPEWAHYEVNPTAAMHAVAAASKLMRGMDIDAIRNGV